MKGFVFGVLSVILVQQFVLPKYADDLWYLEKEYNISMTKLHPIN